MRYWLLNLKLTHVLIFVNVLLMVLVQLLATLNNTTTTYILYMFGAEHFPSIVGQGQVWRLILPEFLHGGFLHLALNMYALFYVGQLIEDFYGARKLFTAYVLSGLCGTALSVGVTLFGLMNSPADLNTLEGTISIGASGAIFGLIGVLLGHTYKRDDYSPKIPVNINGLWMFVLVNLFFGFGGDLIGLGINNAAHIGGLVGGVLLGLLFSTKNAAYVPGPAKILEQLLFALSVLLVVFSVFSHLFFFLF